jgi:hypothetical protein
MSQHRAPRLQAYIWWCGDDDCDCVQPVVDRVEPSPTDRRFWKRTNIWEGTFVSRGGNWGDPEMPTKEDLEAELHEACERFQIPWDQERLDKGLSLERDWRA